MREITVRFIHDDDRPAVLEMLASSPDFPQSIIDSYRRRGPYETLIAIRGSQVDGILSGSFNTDLSGNPNFDAFTLPPRPHGFLARVFVRKEAREHKVGRALIHGYAAEAASWRCTFVGGVLDHASDPQDRRRFFERVGFTLTTKDVFGAEVAAILPGRTAPG